MVRSRFRPGTLLMLMLAVGVLLSFIAPPAMSLTLTPEALKAWFIPFAPVAMVIFGFAVKYIPWLAKLPNDLIEWLNTIVFIVATTAGIDQAQAGPFGDAARIAGFTLLDNVVRGVVHARVARELYEGYGRSLMERVFGLRKAVPGRA